MMEALHRLDSAALRELAASLRQGSLASGLTSHAVQQVVGAKTAPDVLRCLQSLGQNGWRQSQISVLAESVATARGCASDPEQLLDLVLSGPDVPGVPTRDTAVVMQTLIEKAQREIILVAYAIHNGQKLFRRLAERMAEEPDLDVWFYLNIARGYNDTSLTSEITRRFAREFLEKHWPWDVRPKLYYDPRTLEPDATGRASLHAKCLIIDSSVALITSANYTEAAQKRNIEAGVVIRYPPCVERVTGYFRGLRESGHLCQCDLGSQPSP